MDKKSHKENQETMLSRGRVFGVLLLLLVFMVSLPISGCGTTIPPGHVGILVNQYGSNRGVQDYTTTTGRVWYNPWTTSVIEYPTFVQTVQWTANVNEGNPTNESITFTTKESVSVNADISLSYQLEEPKIPAFYVKFRSDDLNNFTYGFLHNVARDALMEVGGHYTVENVMGDNEKFLHEVRDRIQSQVGPVGVDLQQFGFIGSPRPPDNVIQAINQAQQAKYNAFRTQNELAQTEAEVAKRVKYAEGEAKYNQTLAASITPALLEKQKLDIQDRWIARWNGVMPQVTTGTNGMFLANIPPQNQQH
jgi:regulator of protease activity HflC (stomatin/prohibitin superfamily)